MDLFVIRSSGDELFTSLLSNSFCVQPLLSEQNRASAYVTEPIELLEYRYDQILQQFVQQSIGRILNQDREKSTGVDVDQSCGS